MAIATEEKKKSKVFIDWKPIHTKSNRGKDERQSIPDLASENDVTDQTLRNWSIEAPPAVQFIFHFMKQTGCTFEELVKECEPNKP